MLVISWESGVEELTSVQAVVPWFHMRVGYLMGTTNKNALSAVKFKLLDDSEHSDQY
jgi:hypothetical protein